MGQQRFTVQGMTCDHCVHAVTEEVKKLPGVESVVVDLGAGLVTVAANRELGNAEMSAAIHEAGYELVTGPGDPHRL